MKNTVYLRRKLKLVVPAGNTRLSEAHVATLLKNIEGLGFTFSKELIERVGTLSLDEIGEWYTRLVGDLRAMVGANVQFKPMYPNFPRQVMETSEHELYINAIFHYLTLRLPEQKTKERLPLLDCVDLKVIDLGDDADFNRIFTRLAASKTSLSAADKEDLAWFVKEYRDGIAELLPVEIPSRENLAYLAGLFLSHTTSAGTILLPHFKTATDVLRLAAALSGGDVSLAAPTKFRTFNRAERRLMLTLLEQHADPTEDMLRRPQPWIRLGEKLHPFEFKKRFPKSCAALDVVRNDKPFETFNGKVELALLYHDTATAMNFLRRRPGEFARRLDHLLRLAEDGESVIDTFRQVAGNVSTPVLLQTLAHFKHRDDRNELRVFFPKGNVAKVKAIENRLPLLGKELCSEVQAICRKVLTDRFASRPALGKTYLDERLKNYLVPFSQRSASKALRTIVRGSKLPLPPGNTVRFFLWWKEGVVNGVPTGRVDIDLSAVIYGADWKYLEHISYTNLKSAKYRAAHSGDIVEAPNGACEFIDIDLESMAAYGGRYVVMSVYAFTRHPYCNLPECHAGWMMRQFPSSGEIFEPRTVQDKIDLAADTRICLPVILDVVERRFTWADLALKSHPIWANNIEGNQKGVQLMGRAITTLVKPTLHDLFDLHVAARGEPSGLRDADTVFSVDRGITPFDTDIIVAEYL